MAKFTVEVDMETKSAKFFLNGNEINVKEFGASQYSMTPYCSDTELPKEKVCTYVNWTAEQDGMRTSYGLSFDSDGGNSESYSVTNYSLSKELGKLYQQTLAAYKLGKALGKKPILVVDLENWTNYSEGIPPLREPTFNKDL